MIARIMHLFATTTAEQALDARQSCRCRGDGFGACCGRHSLIDSGTASLKGLGSFAASRRETHQMDTPLLIKLLNIAALLAMMLSIGMTVKIEQVIASARNVRLVVLGVLANFALVPLVTVGLLAGFHVAPLVSAGFLILAVCPGAPVGPTFTAIAKGNVAAATGLMVILAALSALLSPALLSFLLARIAPEGNLHIDYRTIVQTLLLTQLLPLALGLGIHWRIPALTERVAKPIGLLANLLLLALVAMIVVSQREMLTAIHVRGWAGMSLLLAASLGIGWFCGARSGDPEGYGADRRRAQRGRGTGHRR